MRVLSHILRLTFSNCKHRFYLYRESNSIIINLVLLNSQNKGVVMKTALSYLAGGILICFLLSTNLNAQDWKNINPNMNNILIDTTLVRATVVTIEPGKKSDVHSHPAHFFYALSNGKLRVHYSDGKNETFDLKAGDSGFSLPERPHVTENVGSKTLKFLLVELKEHPYKDSKK